MDGFPSVNYFTCTLAEAAQHKRLDETSAVTFSNVLDLIDEQARKAPAAPAVGFANFTSNKSPQSDLLSFQQLRDLSWKAAGALSQSLGGWQDRIEGTPGNIGLLSTSDIDFILTWLGLMRLGYSVLFVAPQLGSDAVSSLCATLEIELIFVANKLQKNTQAIESQVRTLRLPDYAKLTSGDDLQSIDVEVNKQEGNPVSDIAYYCHTSGTSSSLPKPIPQYHKGVVGALCGLPGNSQFATFSTTPLYHGGLPDCFRAWASGAMVWFFPEGFAPVTSGNILKALEYAKDCLTERSIKYFSSVPYVLQMLSEEEEGLRMLQQMDLVGVGGAALPTLTGNKLVASGVCLVSRMGSAECGFLMSSHRDYAKDKDWDFLRPVQDVSLLQFEEREDGLSELIVKPWWPCLVKSNREDGSYATADLFEPHSSIPNAWRYHSRADAQITLSNGKKFDPAPIEGRILASRTSLRDVLIFGAGRDYPGALLFPKLEDISTTQEIIDCVWPVVRDMNSTTQNHAQLSKSMLHVVPVSETEQPLEKSSKGTILRGRATRKYESTIDAVYSSDDTLPPSPKEDGHADLYTIVTRCFQSTLGRHFEPDLDLYQQGVDSIACIRVRKAIEASLTPNRPSLPLNIVYDAGTINGLVDYLRKDFTRLTDLRTDTVIDTMKRVAEKYSYFEDFSLEATEESGDIDHKKKKCSVVLTGATGFLGAHILHLLRQNEEVDTICCLIRAETATQGRERVSQALTRLHLPSLDQKSGATSLDQQLMFMPWSPGNPRTGLSEADMATMETVDPSIFIHSAWAVNFALNLDSFENQISGTHDLIETALKLGSQFIFVSSTAAVLNSAVDTVQETVSYDPHEASALGYSQSKWVGEQVCVAARNHLNDTSWGQPLLPHSRPSVTIVRVGQLCAGESGVWNMAEAFPLMLSTAAITRCLPDIPGETLDWLPVDQAAQAVIEAFAISQNTRAPASQVELGSQDLEPDQTSVMRIFHVLNKHHEPTWRQLLQWIQEKENSREASLEVVQPSIWVQRLQQAVQEKHPNHPSQALLGLWEERFGTTDTPEIDTEGHMKTVPAFDTAQAERSLASMKRVGPLSKEKVIKIWDWVQGECNAGADHGANGTNDRKW